jgi:deoxycytidylate deaminase
MRTRKKVVREYLNRDDYFMGMAFMVAGASRSLNRQGAVITAASHEMIAAACDGTPKPIASDNQHFLHAEINTLILAQPPIAGGTMYVTHTPCYGCVMQILAAGIRRIVYFPTKTPDPDAVDATHSAYSQLEPYKGNLNWIRDYLRSMEENGIFSHK